MTVTERELDKGQLIDLLKYNLKWSESMLRSFTYDNLSNLYQHILNGVRIHKAKVSEAGRFDICLHLPTNLRRENRLLCGDWCNIKLNVHKKEVYLDFSEKGKYKINSEGKIRLPYALVEKNVLKQADDAMLYYEDGRITIKSFTYMQ